MANNAADKWSEADTTLFLELGDYFIPEREHQFDCFSALVPTHVAHPRIVEIGCGEGVLADALLQAHPQTRYCGLDGSDAMRRTASGRLAKYGPRAELRGFDLHDAGWRQFPWHPDMIVSSLVIHHLDGPAKRQLFADLHQVLSAGGVLAIADIVLPATSPGLRLAAASWDEAVLERSERLEGSRVAFERFEDLDWNLFKDPASDPADQPSSLFDQLKWLAEAGFVNVDVHWMKAGHALFSGQKAGV